jgi:hypothetical protein
MLPARLFAGGVSLPHHLNLSHTQEGPVDTVPFGSNSTTSSRFDLVYATLNRFVSATGSRKVKDVQSGQVSTQVLNLETRTQAVLSIIPGVSLASAAAATPADPPDGSA